MEDSLLNDNIKLVEKFGAQKLESLIELPDFYTFHNGSIFSHRDFDKFYKALQNNEPCAIVSGFNASGTIHLGHKPVFDTNLFFQKEFDIPIFIPISDDESYVAGKVSTQEESFNYAINLSKELLAYGFDPNKTYFIIDQVYTNIYNLAFKLSKKLTLSQIKTTYGYANYDNPGLIFYPAVQSAHILLPQEKFGINNVLVNIGPDEDAHIRICRDLAKRFGYNSPSVLHFSFLPGIDGKKMSKSRNNAIFLKDKEEVIRKKVRKSFSGGGATLEEHLKYGGNPDVDIACIYLSKLFLNKEESDLINNKYRQGKILSGEVKNILIEKISNFNLKFAEQLSRITDEMILNCLLYNDQKISI